MLLKSNKFIITIEPRPHGSDRRPNLLKCLQGGQHRTESLQNTVPCEIHPSESGELLLKQAWLSTHLNWYIFRIQSWEYCLHFHSSWGDSNPENEPRGSPNSVPAPDYDPGRPDDFQADDSSRFAQAHQLQIF